MQENGVREAHEVSTRQGARPVRVGAPSTLVSRTSSFFLKFLNIPKLIKIAIRIVLESVYLLRESWIRGCPDGRTMTFGRTPGL